MPSKYRQNRINDEMRRELCEIIRTVKDPRVSDALVIITAVDCAADLKTAKVYFSTVSGTDHGMSRDDIRRGLTSAQGYIRGQLAQRLNLRMTPQLTFISDQSLEKGAEVTKLLNQITAELEEREGAQGEEENE